MSAPWTQVLAMLALQHAWQSAVLVALIALGLRLRGRIDAATHSQALLCAIVLAALLPLAVLLPRAPTAPTPSSTVASAAVIPASTGPAPGIPTTATIAQAQPTTAARILIRIGLTVWLLGFLYAALHLGARWRATRRLRRSAIPLSRTGRVLPRAFPVGVAMGVSDQITSPMVIGCRRPCIVLPRAWLDELPDATVLHILRHELAHVRRGDLWIALLVSAILAVYWWNPLLWWLRARLDVAREMACDEVAAVRVGDATDYAHALLASVGTLLAPERRRHAFAVGISGSRSALNQRIEGLLAMNTSNRLPGSRKAHVICAAIVIGSLSMTLYATPRMGPVRSLATHARAIGHAGDAESLVAAVRARRADTIRRLVANGADINAPLPGDGTALIVAVKQHDMPIIKELIALGADVNQSSHGDGNPLIAAAASGDLDAAKALVDAGANVDAIVVDDETALINASRFGHLGTVKYLVEHGADINLDVYANGNEWRSPLNQAANAAIRNYLAAKGAVARK